MSNLAVQNVDAMTLIGQAVQQGAGMESIDKLIELVKFNDSREAMKAFNTAFTKAQAEFPRIQKTKKAHNSFYAPFADIVKQITPVLIKHGLSFRHEVHEHDKGVSVTCILAHEMGHSEKATLTAGPDASGSKNSIQAIGSSVTYLKRYTFEAVTGVVTTDDDDDANSVSYELISKEQELNIVALMTEKGVPEERILNAYKVTMLANIPAKAYSSVISRLQATGVK